MKNYLLKIFIVTALAFSCSVAYVHAIEDSFQTTLTVTAEDLTAPSIPANLVATGVSTSQINLSWDASTDDVGVQGYRIYRDNIIIASTTSITYSDTGLTASTTYTYNVEAFDSVPRYSGLSNTATSSTLAPSAPSSGSGAISGTNLKPMISNLIAISSQNYSIINFDTNDYTIAKLQWGTTKDYEMGTISGALYSTQHSIRIDGLEASTKYYYKVEVTNSFGVSSSEEAEFITQNLIKYVVPNVTNLKAEARKKDSEIRLKWDNPRNFDFDAIRVVRSDKFFPSDINEGEIVFEGNAEKFTDNNVVEGVTYYYSVFVRDNEGRYSSGALVLGKILKDGESVATSTDPFAGINIMKNVHPDIAKLTLLDFDFIQDGRRIVSENSIIAVDGSKNLTIVLDYDKVPEILKTIAFTLIDPQDPTKVFPFLLRVNDDKTAYEATIAPLGRDGIYGLKVMILDYKNQGLLKLEGSLRAFVFGSMAGILGENASLIRKNSLSLIVLIMLCVAVYALKNLNRKRHEA